MRFVSDSARANLKYVLTFFSRFCYRCRMWRVIMTGYKAPFKTYNPLWKAEIRRQRRKLLSPELLMRPVNSLKDKCFLTVFRYRMQLPTPINFSSFYNYLISMSVKFNCIVLCLLWTRSEFNSIEFLFNMNELENMKQIEH